MFFTLITLASALSFNYLSSTTTNSSTQIVKCTQTISPQANQEIFNATCSITQSPNTISPYLSVYLDFGSYVGHIEYNNEPINYSLSIKVYNEYNDTYFTGYLNLMYDTQEGSEYALTWSQYDGYEEEELYIDWSFYFRSQEEYNGFLEATTNDNEAYQSGFDSGKAVGKDEGYKLGYDEGKADGDSEGYRRGLEEGISTGDYGYIFTGILDVGLLPVNVFLAMLNIDFFGINIGGFLTGILTMCVIIVCAKAILGSGGGKE